ncbi:MAG: hypothetical protein DRP58_02705 [Spirochaetes bacterium]|nr:MAG: hypothetical protein DRP58_02705 [Spirochaetota bacterium]
MNYFFDTSALIKNYIEEIGSDHVSGLMDSAAEIFVSTITIIECYSTLRRILVEKLITEDEYSHLKKKIAYDFDFFNKIEFENSTEKCEQLIDAYQLKTLDSIQLAASLTVLDEIDNFVCCDIKLLNAAERENLDILNPIDMK